jgi:predicted component of type VI protein secretion system
MTSRVISITEVTVLAGKTKGFKLDVNGQNVTIPVDEALFAHYQNQIWREQPTPKQKRVFATVMSLMRAAYLYGLEDGKSKK